jgi:YfiH family protein
MLKGTRASIITESELQSRLLAGVPGVLHSFGTRSSPTHDARHTRILQTQWKQVHGVTVSELTGLGQVCGECDGFWTAVPGIPAAVVTADCVPILLARRDGKSVAALHAGWRGTYAEICKQLFQKHLVETGQRPWEWIAAIGPCARECCYEVSVELASDFAKKFGQRVIHKKRNLDLVRANLLQLQELGIEEVDTQPAHCTLCSRDEAGQFAFHSFRREQSNGRQYSWIERA